MLRANCRDGPADEVFFPPRRPSSKSRDAKKVCVDCPVTLACLRYAFRTGSKYGVFGGLSEAERDALLKKIQEESAHGCTA